jgi:hypothetical protein
VVDTVVPFLEHQGFTPMRWGLVPSWWSCARALLFDGWRCRAQIHVREPLQLRARQTPALALAGEFHKNALHRISRRPDHFGIVEILVP